MTSSFEIPVEESVEVLKRVLPMMSSRNIPTIPQNYEVWYDYAKRENYRLNEEIENLIANGQTFDPEVCQQVYEKFYEEETREAGNIQGLVRNAVQTMLQELSGLGSDISHFSGVLDNCNESLSNDPQVDDLHQLVMELARETRQAYDRSKEVENSLHNMAGELTELRAQVDRLSRDSVTDALTGVANRRAFDDAMKQMTGEAQTQDTPLCLILADIDHFKSFNDTHGHVVGDSVLRFVAHEMAQCVKGKDLLARYGGEEFAVLLPNTPLSGAMKLGESIRAIIEHSVPEDDDGNSVDRVTVSLGVALYQPGEEVVEFIERADACLYTSKEQGRNRVTG